MIFPLHIRLLQSLYRITRKCARIAMATFLLFLLLDLVFPIHLPNQYSTMVYAADGSLLHAYLSPDQKWRMEFELEEITPQIRKAFIAKEDRYFYQHPGVNPFAALRAAARNLLTGRRTSGASTITMQVVRLIEPRPRTLGSKLIETFRALQLEWRYGKEEILRQYLNRVPCGGNIEGIKAASQFYFGKQPDRLSLAEVTVLTIVPNRPSSLKPGKDNEHLRQARNQWLQQFENQAVFSLQEIKDALQEPLQVQRASHPALAPHLSHRLHQQFPQATQIQTTLHPEKQTTAEQLTQAHVQQLKAQGVTNAAVMVIDNPTRKVVAYVGSNDFADETNHGQVDGLQAVRSPGSALKPLVYALAIDKGIVSPKSILLDIPINYAGYEPENYDGGFRGPVTAEKSLSWSLNIPAVRLLEQMQVQTIANTLSHMNFRTVTRQQESLGLSLALGGCGVTPEEMGGLYAMFANGGQYAPLQYLQSEPAPSSTPILSPQCAWILAEMLTQTTRPDLPMNWKSSEEIPQIAWKTGTSYGRRDAWSIGYNPRYTIVVWLGKFTGEPVPAISGAETATPLLFKLFRAIDRSTQQHWYAQPPDLETQWVCAETGLLPGEYCTQRITDYHIAGQRQHKRCTHLTQLRINPDSTISYCRTCSPTTGYIEAIYPQPEPALAAWYHATQAPVLAIPPHNPACERIFEQSGPRITSPVEGMDYWIQVADSMKIALQCQVENDVRQVIWFLNDRYIGQTQAGSVLFCTPPTGIHKLTCTDDKGRKTERIFKVHAL